MTNDKSAKFRWLSVWIGILTLCGRAIGQKRPPSYSRDEMPVTNFSCRDKIVGGYYADFETDCRMFHICVPVPGIGVRDFRFLCPNDTLFDQENQICDDWYNIDCQLSSIYSDNFDLYRLGANGEIKKVATTNKRIPLGPSSTIKPPWWFTNKPKKNQYEDEDDYKRSGNDILRGSFYARSNHLRSYANDNFNSANYRKLNRTDTEVKKTKTPTRNVADKGTIRKPIQQYHSNSRWITSIANPVSIRQHSANFTNNRITDAEKTAQSRNNYTSPGTTTRKETLLETTTITNPAFVIHRRINDLDEIELEHGRVVANPAKLYENSDNSRRIVNSDTTGSTETVRLPSTDHLRLRVIAQTYRQPAILINNQLRYTSDEDRRYDIAQSIPTTALPYLTHQQLLTTPKAPNYPIFIVGQLNSIFDTNGRHEKYRSSTVNPYSSNIVTRDVHQSALKVIGLDPSVTFRTVDESLTSALSLNNSMNSIDDGKRQLNVNVTLNPVHSVNTDRSIDVRTNKSVISISTTSNYDQIRRFWKSNLSMFAAIGSNSTAGDRSQDYDYAYYDNSNESSEDDEVNTIAKAFAKLEKTINKKQKTVK